MPYYHADCGGKISVRGRRCSRCGKKWSIKAWFQYPLPLDIINVPKGHKVLKSRRLNYAKWATKYPGVAEFADKLPRWPRWARIVIFICILAVLGFISYKIWGLFSTWIGL